MLCTRVKRGLPFSCLMVVKLLLDSALARTQRDIKVTLCHYLWMQNHLHLLLVAHDANQAKKFYMELQKKITDYFKCLLGKDELTLWEGRPSLARVLDVEQAISEICYYYLNPARANLVDAIDSYPGLSSWEAFQDCAAEGVNASVARNVRWIRQPMIPKLPSNSLTEQQDRFFSAALLRNAKIEHNITVQPNAWMKCFGITEPSEIREINQRIFNRIQKSQLDLAAKRQREGIKLVGAHRLKTAPITFDHRPKKKTRRIYVLAKNAAARITHIMYVRKIVAFCKELYKKACAGENVQWPPGVFVPALPPRASAVDFG